MKRSEINRILQEGIDFVRKCNFALPPFAFWTPEDWKAKGQECDEIRRNMLGWDVTDLGLGQYEQIGLLLFTIRNGNVNNPDDRKSYAEKIIILRPGQHCPLHFHWSKMEDIINRAGGDLVMKLYNSLEDGEVDAESPVKVGLDGVETELPPGGIVRLKNGESITLTRGLYHEFWAEGSVLLAGEVSAVNDDTSDNRFAEPMGRFPVIEEDEPPLYYLCNEYPAAD